MTASGNCDTCGKLAKGFHYRTPYNGNGHDGFWYCEEHSPSKQKSSEITESSRGKELTSGMNRAERRAFERRNRG